MWIEYYVIWLRSKLAFLMASMAIFIHFLNFSFLIVSSWFAFTFCPWSPSGPLVPAGPWGPVKPAGPSTPLRPGGPGTPDEPYGNHKVNYTFQGVLRFFEDQWHCDSGHHFGPPVYTSCYRTYPFTFLSLRSFGTRKSVKTTVTLYQKRQVRFHIYRRYCAN